MKYLLYFTLPFYILDQVTKEWVTRRFEVESFVNNDFIPVIPGFFNLVRVHNTGMAFGLANGAGFANYLFLGIAALAITFITYLWRKGMFATALTKTAVALLISGILGNVTDRLCRGYVVDFLDFNLGFMRWPSFNVADACICVAAGLLMIGSFQAEDAAGEPQEKKKAREA